ncbi:MAG: TetR/AcrR family transcriptional regulator [Actinomycetes bacterium]
MTSAPSPRRPYAPRLPADQRRDQLLDAALGIALDHGFHAVTVDGVARAAGVTRPVVYGLFADRAELLSALLDRSSRRAAEQLTGVLPEVPSPGEATDPDRLLVEGLTAFWRAVLTDRPTWRVILTPPEGAPAELRQRVDDQRRDSLRRLRRLVTWGLAARGGPSGLDAELFARSVLTLAEDGARLLLAGDGRFDVDRLGGFAERLMQALARR